jgi:DNA replication protein DnaC
MAHSEEAEMAELTAMLEAKRAELGVVLAEPAKVEVPATPQREVRDDYGRTREEQARYLEQREKIEAWHGFINRRGSRYADCRFANYEMRTDAMKPVLESLKEYCDNWEENLASGRNVILFGPKGAGKDHLATAMVHCLIGKRVRPIVWVNGLDMFGDFRDLMDSDDREAAYVDRMIRAPVLYISDPVPPVIAAQDAKSKGALTEYQSGMLFRILDGRYSRRKPTWITANASSGADLEARMGAQLVDRLRDDALVCHCGWESSRKPWKIVKG